MMQENEYVLESPFTNQAAEPTENSFLLSKAHFRRKLCSKENIKVFVEALGESSEALLTIQALSTRWVYQLLLTLEHEGVVMSKDTKDLLNSLSPVVPILLTGWAIYYNKRHNNDTVPAGAQDFARALFSSSFILIFLDMVSSNKSLGANLPAFITLTAASALFSIVAASNSLSTIANQSIFCRDNAYYQAAIVPVNIQSVKEDILNMLQQTVEYGLFPLVISWLVRREMEGFTQTASSFELGLAGASAATIAGLSYNLSRYPKLFDYVALLSRTITNSSLSYAAASGLFYQILALACDNDMECMGSEQLRSIFTVLCAALTIMSGGYTILRSGLRFDAMHQQNIDFFNKASKVGGAIYSGLTKVGSCMWSCIASETGAKADIDPNYELVTLGEGAVDGDGDVFYDAVSSLV